MVDGETIAAMSGTDYNNNGKELLSAANIQILTGGVIEFEGATADNFETTLTVTDPTADRTITLPDASGIVATRAAAAAYANLLG